MNLVDSKVESERLTQENVSDVSRQISKVMEMNRDHLLQLDSIAGIKSETEYVAKVESHHQEFRSEATYSSSSNSCSADFIWSTVDNVFESKSPMSPKSPVAMDNSWTVEPSTGNWSLVDHKVAINQAISHGDSGEESNLIGSILMNGSVDEDGQGNGQVNGPIEPFQKEENDEMILSLSSNPDGSSNYYTPMSSTTPHSKLDDGSGGPGGVDLPSDDNVRQRAAVEGRYGSFHRKQLKDIMDSELINSYENPIPMQSDGGSKLSTAEGEAARILAEKYSARMQDACLVDRMFEMDLVTADPHRLQHRDFVPWSPALSSRSKAENNNWISPFQEFRFPRTVSLSSSSSQQAGRMVGSSEADALHSRNLKGRLDSSSFTDKKNDEYGSDHHRNGFLMSSWYSKLNTNQHRYQPPTKQMSSIAGHSPLFPKAASFVSLQTANKLGSDSSIYLNKNGYFRGDLHGRLNSYPPTSGPAVYSDGGQMNAAYNNIGSRFINKQGGNHFDRLSSGSQNYDEMMNGLTGVLGETSLPQVGQDVLLTTGVVSKLSSSSAAPSSTMVRNGGYHQNNQGFRPTNSKLYPDSAANDVRKTSCQFSNGMNNNSLQGQQRSSGSISSSNNKNNMHCSFCKNNVRVREEQRIRSKSASSNPSSNNNSRSRIKSAINNLYQVRQPYNESEFAAEFNHHLKDRNGFVMCPILRKHQCENCGATGDYAHTIRYCPIVKETELIAHGLSMNVALSPRKHRVLALQKRHEQELA